MPTVIGTCSCGNPAKTRNNKATVAGIIQQEHAKQYIHTKNANAKM